MARAIKFNKKFGGREKGEVWPMAGSSLAQKLVRNGVAEFVTEKAGDAPKAALAKADAALKEAQKTADQIVKDAEEAAKEIIADAKAADKK